MLSRRACLRGSVPRELRDASERGAARSLVVSGDDAWPLRAALLVRHLDPDVPIVVTIFDPATGRELEQQIGNCTVTSLAAIVALSCRPLLRRRSRGGAGRPRPARRSALRRGIGRGRFAPRRCAYAEFAPCNGDREAVRSQRRPACSLARSGFCVVLIFETVAAALVLEQNLVDAFYGAVKTLVTVDPNLAAQDGPDWFKLVISASMIIALLFAAAFTGGLVERLIGCWLTGLSGRPGRAALRSRHRGWPWPRGLAWRCSCAAAACRLSPSTSGGRARTSATPSSSVYP